MIAHTLPIALLPGPPVVRPAAHNHLLALTFQIGHQQYGLPVAAVLEIVRLPALVELAGAPPALCGLLNLRGRYIPVLHGRVLVGMAPLYELSNQIVIIGAGEGQGEAVPLLGLLVDQVRDVTTFAADRCTPIGTGAAAFLGSVAQAEEGSVVFFDVPALLEQRSFQ